MNVLHEFVDIEEGNDEALRSAPCALLRAYLYYVFCQVPDAACKSVLIAVLGQVRNWFILFCIYLSAYLVDVVLNTSDAGTADRLLVSGSRSSTLTFCAFLFMVSGGATLLLETWCSVMQHDLGSLIVRHHVTSLLQKYARDDGRVPGQDLAQIVNEEIPDLVQGGYLVVFPLIQDLGTFNLLFYFLVYDFPPLWWIFVAYMFLVLIFTCMRKTELLRQGRRTWVVSSQARSALMQFALEEDEAHRQVAIGRCEKQLAEERSLRCMLLNNEQFVWWLTLAMVGCYVLTTAQQVSEGSVTLSDFKYAIVTFLISGIGFDRILKYIWSHIAAAQHVIVISRLVGIETGAESEGESDTP